MSLIRIIVLVLCLCPLGVQAAKLSSIETPYFEVVGTDNRSVAFVSDLAEHIVKRCSSFLPDNGVGFSRRILIALRPHDSVDFEGDSKLTIGDQGMIRLDFHWHENITLEQTCYEITQALLTRYAIYQYGPSGPSQIKAWCVHALALESLYTVRPSLIIVQLKASQSEDAIETSVLLNKTLNDELDKSFSYDAYYFLSALRKSLLKRKLLRSVIENAISGGDPSQGIAKILFADVKPEETLPFELWWQAQRDELLSAEFDIFERMEDSRAWIEQMTDFEVFASTNNEYKNLRSLWKFRDDNELRVILSARLELLSLRLEIVNPLYFNSAQSLGSMFEILLDEEARAYEFMHKFVSYLSDLQDAKKIEKTSLDLLDAMQ